MLSWRNFIRRRGQSQAEPANLILVSSVWLAVALPLALLALANPLLNPMVPAPVFLLAFGLALSGGILAGYVLLRPFMPAMAQGNPVLLRPLMIHTVWDFLLVTLAAFALAGPLANLVTGDVPPHVISGLAAGLTGTIVSGYVIGAGAVKAAVGIWWYRISPRRESASTSAKRAPASRQCTKMRAARKMAGCRRPEEGWNEPTSPQRNRQDVPSNLDSPSPCP